MDKATQMMVFVRTVDGGSFSAAARSLDLTPSSVSRQISLLEDRLGARLLNRSTRRLSLTEAGQTYYEHCARIIAEMDDADEAVSSLQGAVRGTLRVTATVAFARIQVVPLVPEFLDRYPDLTLQLELTDRRVDLIEEGVDAAIRLSEQLAEPSIVARKLAPNRRIVCATPGYLAAHGTPRTPDDLKRHNCLHMYTLAQFNEWEFEDPDGVHMIRVNGRFRANTADALYQAVLAGVGVGRLATFLVGGDIKAGRLVPLLPTFTHEKSAIYVLYPHRRNLAPKVRAFVDFLVEKFTPVPPWEPD